MTRMVVFLAVAVPISLCDLREKRIPNVLVSAGLLLALWCASRSDEAALMSLLLGGALGFAIFWCVWYIFRGKIGFGDVKYVALLGAFSGVRGLCEAVFAASVTGLLFALVAVIIDRRNLRARIPFAPFLSIGGMAALLLQLARWPDFPAGGAP